MDNNAGPVLDNPGVQYCSAGQHVALNLGAYDQSSDNLTFSETGLPDGLHLDANNGVITGIVADDAVSTTPDDVSVTVTDGLGNHSTVEFDWCVALSSDENDVLAGVFGIVDFEAIRRTRTIWFFEGRVIGAAPGVVTIQLGGLPSLIASASFNVNADGTFVVSETLGANEYGTATARATDSAGNQSNLAVAMVRNRGFRWQGTSADAGPVLDNPGVQYCSAGQYVALNLRAFDQSSDNLTFSETGLPDGLTLDPDDGVITGIVADDAVSTTPDDVSVTVTDGLGNHSTVDFEWCVTLSSGGSDDPEGDFGIFDFAAVRETGNVWIFEGRVIGADSGPVTIHLGGLPSLISSASFDLSADGTFEVTCTLGVGESGTATALATDSDSNQSNLATAIVTNGPNIAAGTTLAVTAASVATEGPVDQVPGPQSVVQNTALVFSSANDNSISISDTDAEGGIILFTLRAANGTLTLASTDGLTFVEGTGSGDSEMIFIGSVADVGSALDGLTFAPTTNYLGDGSVQIVSGALGQSGTTDIMLPITVNPVVSLTDPGDQSNFDGDTVSLPLSATDAFDNPLTYAIASGTLPPGLTLDSSSGIISGTIASNAVSGSPYAVSLTATDAVNGASAVQTIYWYVSLVTVMLNNPGDQSNCVGDAVTLALPRSDSADNALTFAATNLPDGLTIDPDSGEITGTIASDNAMSTPFAVTVTATDTNCSVSASQTFYWNIVPILIDNPGTLDNFDGDAVDLPLQTDTSYTVTDALAYSATGLPSGMSLDSGSGVISGTLASDADIDSPYSVVVTVTDPNAGVSASRTFLWYVEANTTTVALANPGNQSNMDGDSVSVSLMGLDSAGDQLTYAATGLPEGLSVVGNQIVGTIASNADGSGPYLVTATAADALAGVSASQTFTWNVAPMTPVVSLANPGNESNVDGDTVDVSLTGSDSADDPLTYSATGLPPGLSLGGNEITGTIADDDYAAGPYAVTLTATDDIAEVSTSQQLIWFCSADASESQAQAPTLTSIESSSAVRANFGQSITLTVAVGARSSISDIAPTGNVTFREGSTILGTVTLNAHRRFGVASFTISTLASGNHTITAVYDGDNNYAGSTSLFFNQTVIGGFATGEVWVDANGNGVLDSGEAGLGGVTVNLLNNRGTVVDTTTTYNSGTYSFNQLLPNVRYAIQFVKPAGYLFTFYQSGNNSAIWNSTPNSNGGVTNYFQAGAVGSTATLNSGLINMSAETAGAINGPGAVPGNSTYTYLLVLTGQPSVMWDERSVGATNLAANTVITGLTQRTYDSATNTTLISLPLTFANTPADIIESVFVCGQVVASKEIYVVQVNIAAGNDLHFTGNGGPVSYIAYQGVALTDSHGAAVARFASAPERVNAADWAATVTLVGPGNNLGVSQINVGFIQHITIQSWSGQYSGVAGGQNNTLVASLQGQTFFDSNYTGPWTVGENSGVFNDASAATDGSPAKTTKPIQGFDTPGMIMPLTIGGSAWPFIANWAQQGVLNTHNPLAQLNLIADFTLDVAATTTDASNGANNSYWAEARANWTFNGTATVGLFNAATTSVPVSGNGAGTNAVFPNGTLSDTAAWSAIVAPTQENNSGPTFNQASLGVTFSPAS